jgi:hypothetical protein
MQTITFNDSNISAYIFEDAQTITSEADKITLPKSTAITSVSGYGLETTIGYLDEIICDMNSSNSTVHTGVTQPADWRGGKYLFDGTTWTSNPNYTEPTE